MSETRQDCPRGTSGDGLSDTRLTRRTALSAGLLGAGVLLLGASPAAQGAVRRRKAATRTVTIVRGVDLSTLEVRKAGAGADLAIIRNIAEPLIRASHQSESDLKPWLATSWNPATPTHWRFHIRPNVTFSDGTPFNVETVKWTIDHLDKEKSNVNAIVMHAVTGAKIVDKNTIDIITSYPSGAVPAELQTVGNMLDPTWEMSKSYSADSLVGSGRGVRSLEQGRGARAASEPELVEGKAHVRPGRVEADCRPGDESERGGDARSRHREGHPAAGCAPLDESKGTDPQESCQHAHR